MKKLKLYPVDTRHRFNVDTMSYRRWNDVVCLLGIETLPRACINGLVGLVFNNFNIENIVFSICNFVSYFSLNFCHEVTTFKNLTDFSWMGNQWEYREQIFRNLSAKIWGKIIVSLFLGIVSKFASHIKSIQAN